MDIKFSIATIDDIAGIIELTNNVFEENTSIEYATRVFEETKNNPDNIYIIGKIENKIVAHAKITIIHTIYEQMNTYAILNHVCVSPEYRRHNLATLMLDEITRICKERKATALKLWSNNYRVAAHACYKHYGFTLDEAGFFSKAL